MSQCDDIQRHLDKGKKLTAMTALRDMGVFRLAARIRDLRERGYPVITTIRVITTQRGTEAKIAEYVKGAK